MEATPGGHLIPSSLRSSTSAVTFIDDVLFSADDKLLFASAGTCRGVMACGGADITQLGKSTATTLWSWEEALTVWVWMTTRCSMQLTSTCEVDGSLQSDPEGGVTFSALTRNINCSSSCCSAGVNDPAATNEHSAKCALSQLAHGANVEATAAYCPFSAFRSWEWAIPLLTAQSTTPLTCVFNPCNMATLPNASGQGGAFECTPVTPSATSSAAAIAFSNVMSTHAYYTNNTCACVTTKKLQGAATSMCSGNGICNSGTAILPAGYVGTGVGQVCPETMTVLSSISMYSAKCATCFGDWTGSGCQTSARTCPTCVAAHTSTPCSTGVDGTVGYCYCAAGYGGPTCDMAECPVNDHHDLCNGVGTCKMGICECSGHFSGSACEHHTKVPKHTSTSNHAASTTNPASAVIKSASTGPQDTSQASDAATFILIAVVVLVVLLVMFFVVHKIRESHASYTHAVTHVNGVKPT